MSSRSLHDALTVFAAARTPTRMLEVIRTADNGSLAALHDSLATPLRARVDGEAERLRDLGVDVLIFGDDDFPESLVHNGRPVAPILFYKGDINMLHEHGLGMCGSRAVTELGLRAASACGEEVSDRGLVVVSGYAKGVDTEAHLAALRAGGRTVIVLAEGFDHFRVKRVFAKDFDPKRVLVVSQFPPSQPWTAHGAMARNAIIYGLGQALVVIEAGERGGTLAAGEGALRLGRPVFVLDFGDDTPVGNKLLLAAGGRSVRSRAELGEAIASLARTTETPVQVQLPY
jgi:DNA processing protein